MRRLAGLVKLAPNPIEADAPAASGPGISLAASEPSL